MIPLYHNYSKIDRFLPIKCESVKNGHFWQKSTYQCMDFTKKNDPNFIIYRQILLKSAFFDPMLISLVILKKSGNLTKFCQFCAF